MRTTAASSRISTWRCSCADGIARWQIAPLTSMFLYSDANRSQFDDLRPAGARQRRADRRCSGKGEAVWRALNNPPVTANSYFAADQRQGLRPHAARAELRRVPGSRRQLRQAASILVEPQGDWGEGSIRLIEVPAKLEADDNIVAFWNPAAAAAPGSRYDLHYKLSWVRTCRR